MPPLSQPPVKDEHATTVKHFSASPPAGAVPIVGSGSSVNRNYYYIENVGLNAGFFWWDQQRNYGQALVIAPGEWREWASKCPIEATWFSSDLGTVFAVIEGMRIPSNG